MHTLPAGNYEEYLIPKKGGKFRKIVAPSSELLSYQRRILQTLNRDYIRLTTNTAIANTAHGFVKGRNCVTAAEQHVGFQSTIMMDISTFFDDVKLTHVPDYPDTNLWHKDGYAAQGFATSPMLANLAFIPVLRSIHEFLDDYYGDFAFTIYADDIQISVNTEDLDELQNIIDAVTNNVEVRGFTINNKKTRIKYAKYGYRRILGVNVGDKEVRATRRTMRKLRAAIHQRNGPSTGGLTTWSKCYRPKPHNM